MRQRKITIWHIFFILYCAVMLWLLFDREGYDPALPYTEQLRYSLIPFRTTRRFLKLLLSANIAYRNQAVINLGGNVIMFIPLGFFLPKLWQKQRKFRRTLLTTAGIIILVELTQMFTLLGTCDIDDLILNVTGAAIGYGFYKIFTNKGLSK